MTENQRAFFRESTTGVPERVAGEAPNEVLAIEDLTIADLVNLDSVGAEKTVAELERLAGLDQPFFMSINWAANYQTNLPSPDFEGKLAIKNKYGEKVVALDYRTGKILEKIKELGIEENTLIIYTVDTVEWHWIA